MWSDDGDGRREEGVRGRGYRFAGQIGTLAGVESSASIVVGATVAARVGKMIVPGRGHGGFRARFIVNVFYLI